MHACLCCLRQDAVALKIDRNGRPFTTCRWCRSRTFLPSPEGLRGLVLLAPRLAEFLAQLGGAGALQAVDAEMPSMIERARVASGLPG